MWCKAQSQGSIGYVVTWQNQEGFKGPNSKVLSCSACKVEVPYPRNCPHQMYQVQLLLLLEVGVASLPVPGMIQEGNYVITQKPGDAPPSWFCRTSLPQLLPICSVPKCLPRVTAVFGSPSSRLFLAIPIILRQELLLS